MSKTYRKVPENLVDVNDLQDKKIKRIDKKHQEIIATDGFYEKPIVDNDGVVYLNPKDKKIIKKNTVKKSRRYKTDED